MTGDETLRRAEEAELAARRARQDAGDEIVSPLADADERAIETALRRAVAAEDLKALTMVPGIGNKVAQRIILELKDRLGAPGDAGPGLAVPQARGAAPSWRDQVMTGLVNLGWSARDAEAAVAAVEADSGGQAPDVATALRAALRKLSKS